MSECGGQGAGCGLRAGEVGSGPAASAVGRVGASAAGARPPPHPPAARRRAAAGCFPQAYGLRRRRQGAVPAP